MIPVATIQGLRGKLIDKAPLKSLNSWRVGGKAKRLYRPADLQDLSYFLSKLAANEPLVWLGLGSNMLIRDGGIPGTVIILHGALTNLEHISPNTVRVEAGVPCAKVARYCAKKGLTGMEFLAGIPGTMGGALAMNAGAFGSETWDLVKSVETIDRFGIIHRRETREFMISYRSVKSAHEQWFVSAHLELKRGERDESLFRVRSLLSKRSQTQPTGVASCGSVFRNPPGHYAAELIESTGLKGFTIGGAQVSTKHANFIVNTGGACAADIEALIKHIQRRVERVQGIRLATEVHIVGVAA